MLKKQIVKPFQVQLVLAYANGNLFRFIFPNCSLRSSSWTEHQHTEKMQRKSFMNEPLCTVFVIKYVLTGCMSRSKKSLLSKLEEEILRLCHVFELNKFVFNPLTWHKLHERVSTKVQSVRKNEAVILNSNKMHNSDSAGMSSRISIQIKFEPSLGAVEAAYILTPYSTQHRTHSLHSAPYFFQVLCGSQSDNRNYRNWIRCNYFLSRSDKWNGYDISSGINKINKKISIELWSFKYVNVFANQLQPSQLCSQSNVILTCSCGRIRR